MAKEDDRVTRITLPGMILLPGSFSGRVSSPIPHRGPEASSLMSLAVYNMYTKNMSDLWKEIVSVLEWSLWLPRTPYVYKIL